MSAVDYKALAEREAAAIISSASAATSMEFVGSLYPMLVTLVAAGWLQGVNYGTHETLALAEAAFERVRDEL